jgi:CDP-6-deoxy-D-xylo-4-hexulose-3-dehydrase
VRQRTTNYQKFHGALLQNPDFLPLATDHMDVVSNFAMPVICRTPELADSYIQFFKDADVEIRPIVGGSIPEQPFYEKLYGRTDRIKNASTINRQGFYFGNNPELTAPELEVLCNLLQQRTAAATPTVPQYNAA